MRCSSCGRLGYMADPSVHVDLRLYACGDDRLVCRGCVVSATSMALTVCVHGRVLADSCFPCEILRAGTQP